MLILTRKPGQTLTISLSPSLDPQTPIRKVFQDFPIEVWVTQIQRPQVKLGLSAHPGLRILRAELPGTRARRKPAPVVRGLASSVQQQLGRRIRVLRAERGWSQEVLAELAGLHRNYVGAVERGKVNVGVGNLTKLAQALGVSVEGLMGERKV